MELHRKRNGLLIIAVHIQRERGVFIEPDSPLKVVDLRDPGVQEAETEHSMQRPAQVARNTRQIEHSRVKTMDRDSADL